MSRFVKNPKNLTRDDVNSGWDMTWRQAIWENRKEIFRWLNKQKKPIKKSQPKISSLIHNQKQTYAQFHSADCHLSVNNNTLKSKPPTQDLEYLTYLQNQTPEQFVLAQKHGWRIAKLLTEPEQNFHEQ